MEVAPGCCLFATEPPSLEGEWGRFRDSGTMGMIACRLRVDHGYGRFGQEDVANGRRERGGLRNERKGWDQQKHRNEE